MTTNFELQNATLEVFKRDHGTYVVSRDLGVEFFRTRGERGGWVFQPPPESILTEAVTIRGSFAEYLDSLVLEHEQARARGYCEETVPALPSPKRDSLLRRLLSRLRPNRDR